MSAQGREGSGGTYAFLWLHAKARPWSHQNKRRDQSSTHKQAGRYKHFHMHTLNPSSSSLGCMQPIGNCTHINFTSKGSLANKYWTLVNTCMLQYLRGSVIIFEVYLEIYPPKYGRIDAWIGIWLSKYSNMLVVKLSCWVYGCSL